MQGPGQGMTGPSWITDSLFDNVAFCMGYYRPLSLGHFDFPPSYIVLDEDNVRSYKNQNATKLTPWWRGLALTVIMISFYVINICVSTFLSFF